MQFSSIFAQIPFSYRSQICIFLLFAKVYFLLLAKMADSLVYLKGPRCYCTLQIKIPHSLLQDRTTNTTIRSKFSFKISEQKSSIIHCLSCQDQKSLFFYSLTFVISVPRSKYQLFILTWFRNILSNSIKTKISLAIIKRHFIPSVPYFIMQIILIAM